MKNQEQNFINHIVELKSIKEKLESQTISLKNEIDRQIKEYTNQSAKFKSGDAVIYLKEKYKTPRKYFIQSVRFGMVELQDDGSYIFKRFYEIATINGHQPNGKWSIEEKDLIPYDEMTQIS